MTQQITYGRYRGLKTTSLSEGDFFGIVAFDQRGSYRRMMPDDTPFRHYTQVKLEVISALSRVASAILTDPIYGLPAAMNMSGQAGLLLALEKTGYSGDATARQLEWIPSWTAEKIRKIGASAAKILVYYNPQAETLADELDAELSDVIAECHRWDLPVFVEPIVYSIDKNINKNSDAFAAQRPDIIVETARRLSQTGADVLKMEFPVDLNFNTDHTEWRKQCERVSEAASVPWALLSAGVDFEQFEPQVRIACESGASGFLAGRAIWKECVTMSTTERATFLRDVASQRVQKLIEIERVAGRPWSDFYTVETSAEKWFESYAN